MRTPESKTAPAVRTDIQGLRALAVSLVLVYHLAPASLTGGFIGVDVFFVISGFLITLHLLQNIPTGPRDLVSFWSNRVRRLLPASLLVLGTTLVASRLLAPETQWENTARQTRAAALYVVNWVLSSDAVDYLAAEKAPSPVQHFWSLAVEEQFYFVWPILILALAVAARKLRQENTLHLVLAGLVMVVSMSLVYSIHITTTNPAAAYFVTPARVWELGIGGVLATVHLIAPGRLRPLFAVPLSWLGVGAIAYAAATYSESTPFPGWQAAVPVLGTAAVIGAHSLHGSGSPGTLFELRPVQWLGDVSYSVYLWHWPLIVILPQVTGQDLTWPQRGFIVVMTLGLASLTKVLVEDRFRTASWAIPMPKPFAVATVAMALVVGGTALQLREVDQLAANARVDLEQGLAGGDPCFGAAALDPGTRCRSVGYDQLLPSPLKAATDKSDAYDRQAASGTDCWSYLPKFVVKTCTFGKKDATTNVVVAGNSHAGQWLPALQRLATANDFKITTLLASQCALSEIRQTYETRSQVTACRRWVDKVVAEVIDLKPDLVVMTNRISTAAEGKSFDGSTASYGAGYRKVLRAWQKAGIRVLVLHDTPAPGDSVPDCIATEGSAFARCDGPRKVWVKPEPATKVVAALGDPRIRFVDLNDHICGPRTCRAVNGGVITYFDGSHLTATYAATLAPYLGVPLLAMLEDARTG